MLPHQVATRCSTGLSFSYRIGRPVLALHYHWLDTKFPASILFVTKL